MSRYFPHTAYAEDQPLAYTILTTHVLTRGLTTGSLLGILASSLRQVVPSYRRPGPALHRVLLSSSTGSLWGLGLTALATAGRMYGREEIEWKDRSWRLLENKGQLEMDDWTYVGMGAATMAALGTGQVRTLRWRAVVGSLGLGGALGMVGSMVWRMGVNRGRFPDKGSDL